jgi:hypothetical protein
MYILYMKCSLIILNMVYSVNKELSHKILFHNPYSFKLMDSLQSVMKLDIPFAKTITHRIFVIYLNHTKLKALKDHHPGNLKV